MAVVATGILRPSGLEYDTITTRTLPVIQTPDDRLHYENFEILNTKLINRQNPHSRYNRYSLPVLTVSSCEFPRWCADSRSG